jgi:hypothetical protein
MFECLARPYAVQGTASYWKSIPRDQKNEPFKKSALGTKRKDREEDVIADGVDELKHDQLEQPSEIMETQSHTDKQIVSRPMNKVRGHTSYLTFASLLPKHTASID